MNKMDLQEKITNMLVDVFMPEGLKEASRGTQRLLVSGVKREVTENIMRLVEDFYEDEVETARAQETPEAVEDNKILNEICAQVEEWAHCEVPYTDTKAMMNLHETLLKKGKLDCCG